MFSFWRFCTKSLIYLFLAALFLVVQVPISNSVNPVNPVLACGICGSPDPCNPCKDGNVKVEVEIETGPEFDPGDADTIWECVKAHYHKKFPFDFVSSPASGELSCPNVTFWDKHYELCWIVDIFHTIEPAIILGMLISAVLWL